MNRIEKYPENLKILQILIQIKLKLKGLGNRHGLPAAGGGKQPSESLARRTWGARPLRNSSRQV